MPERSPHRIYFDSGVAHTVTLKFQDGFKTSYGNILYTTTEEKQFFVPEEVSHKIQALGLGELEPLTIMKRGVGDQAKWIVSRVKEERPMEPAQGLATMKPAPVTAATSSGNTESLPSQSQDNSLARRMASCYVAAIDALMIAKQYADSKNVTFRITEEEIRASASCIFIECGKIAERQIRYANSNHTNGGASWRQ